MLSVETEQGNTPIPLAELASGAPRRYLDGQIEARRVPTYAPLVAGPDQEDFPAAAPDEKGAFVVYVAHEPRGSEVSKAFRERPASFQSFKPGGGGDRIEIIRYDKTGRTPGAAVDLTGPGHDVWRPAAARDSKGNVVIVWSEMKEGNWDLYAASYDPEEGSVSETKRLTTDPGTDTAPALATAPDGTVWVAWQAFRNGQAEILLAPLSQIDQPRNVSNHPANDWSPALAFGPDGPVVAFDTYRNGSYDVLLARVSASGPISCTPVANSTRFEARPSLAVDAKGRAWVAYEERDDNWGKDFGNLPEVKGASLYHASIVKVRCVEGSKVLDVADPVAGMPPQDQRFNAFPRLALDASGHPWLLYRHRQEAIWGNNAVMVVGAVWVEYATMLSGRAWTAPEPLPRSDNMLDNRPALVARPDGGLLAFYASDGRLHREVEHSPELSRMYYTHSGTPPGVVNNDLFLTALIPPKDAADPDPGTTVAADPNPATPTHPNEAADIERMRGHRIEAGGKEYRLLRGEFHRHTEISQDGGNDGALEDMWRYALDAGRLDWIGCGDHDNGGGKEYTWWLTQKTTDLYHNPPAFVPMFTYERSVNYPGGHRNVMFPYRGVRTLPRLIDENGVKTDVRGRDEDAAMLYAYLNELGGICASHTSGTGMGTDWRANDPKAEPVVEIYQGIRNSYETLGGPRIARGPFDAVGGWKPLGMVWNALAMQYRIGFQSSSDHVSTHISFAVAIAEEPTRKAIFEAFQKRHCYAATDNIVLDVRCGAHLVGDEFESEGPVTLKIVAHGTGAIQRVDIIKDFLNVFSTEPKAEKVSLTWTDDDRGKLPVSWYYVRIVQQNGEVAWASPMWIHQK